MHFSSQSSYWSHVNVGVGLSKLEVSISSFVMFWPFWYSRRCSLIVHLSSTRVMSSYMRSSSTLSTVLKSCSSLIACLVVSFNELFASFLVELTIPSAISLNNVTSLELGENDGHSGYVVFKSSSLMHDSYSRFDSTKFRVYNSGSFYKWSTSPYYTVNTLILSIIASTELNEFVRGF